jgi:hypothetical protein
MMTETTYSAPIAVPDSAPAAPTRRHAPLARGSARSALQWRLLALWIVVLLVPTALATLPLWQVLSASLDNSVHAPELAYSLDMIALGDLQATLTRPGSAVGYGGVLALLLTLLLSPLLTGMTVSAARAPQPPGFRALLGGGIQEYTRMLRMLLWAVVPLSVVAVLARLAMSAAGRYGESAVLESAAAHAQLTVTCGAALLFALACATLDAGRAVLAADLTRRSAVVAWWRGVQLIGARPLASFGSWLAISAVGLALAAGLAVARLRVPALGIGGFAAAFVLTQLTVSALAWMRCARLFAMVKLAQRRQA